MKGIKGNKQTQKKPSSFIVICVKEKNVKILKLNLCIFSVVVLLIVTITVITVLNKSTHKVATKMTVMTESNVDGNVLCVFLQRKQTSLFNVIICDYFYFKFGNLFALI